jgi:hypothetical protein
MLVTLALGVQLEQRLSLIPGWAGVTALRPDSRGRAYRGPTGPLIFSSRVLLRFLFLSSD